MSSSLYLGLLETRRESREEAANFYRLLLADEDVWYLVRATALSFHYYFHGFSVSCFTMHYLVVLHHGCSVDPFAAAAAAFFPFISFLLSGFGRHELTGHTIRIFCL